MADFRPIYKKTLNFEGGYQNYSNDSANYCGGKLIGTNRGISAQAYHSYYGVCPTVSKMKALTEEDAYKIYKSMFWDKILGDKIKDQSVAHIFFQSFIGSGYIGLEHIRSSINKVAGKQVVASNGVLTQKDIDIVNSLPQKKLFEDLWNRRLAFLRKLAKDNPAKYGTFIQGWENRMNQIIYTGIEQGVKIVKENKVATIFVILGLGIASYFIYRKYIKG